MRRDWRYPEGPTARRWHHVRIVIVVVVEYDSVQSGPVGLVLVDEEERVFAAGVGPADHRDGVRFVRFVRERGGPMLGDELGHGGCRVVPPQCHVLEVRVRRWQGEPAAGIGRSRGGCRIVTGRGHLRGGCCGGQFLR